MAEKPSVAGTGITRRRFFVAAGCCALALMVGRRAWPQAEQTGEARPRRAENLRERRSASGLELHPTPIDERGPVFHLNRSAAVVWRGVDGRHTVSELAATLAAACGISAAAARSDTVACLEDLAAQGLVFDLRRCGA